MSKLEDLLKGVKVELLSLKEIAELQRGKTITSKNKTEGNIPVISGGQKPAYYNGEFNRTDETITIAGSGAYAGYISYWNEPIFVSDAFSIKPDLSILNIKYAYYFLLTKQKWIYSLKKGAGIPHVYPKDLEKLQIPIPCPDNPKKSLEIQKEIVRVLDQLTETTNKLKNELETERENRKKQYEHYCEQLFRFESKDVEWKEIKDVFSIKRGKRLIKSELLNIGKYAVFQNSMKPLGFYNEYNVKSDTTFIISAGSAGEIGFSNNDFWAADDVYYFISPKNVINKFLFYFLLNNKYKIQKKVRRSSVPRLSKDSFEKILFPIPSIEEQERIVKLLDEFEATYSAIEKELTKEIKLRTQQYEYYREKLLTFPEN